MKILLILVVFFIVSMSVVAQSSGSAIAIDRQYVATCYHVIENAQTIKIIVDTISGSEYLAEVVAVDEQNDLAILKIADSNFPGFEIKYGCETRIADVGTNIYVLGYPLIMTMGSEIKLTTGVISSSTGFQGDASKYQISAPVQPGNSGGPVFDENGNLMGIVCGIHEETQNVGYAVKISYLQKLIESVDENITLPTINSISAFNIANQVKVISPCVPRIVAIEDTILKQQQAEEFLREAKAAYFIGNYEDAFVSILASVDLHLTDEAIFWTARIAYPLWLESKDESLYKVFCFSIECCIRNDYEVSECYYLVGQMCMIEGYYEKAIQCFNKSLEADPSNYYSQRDRGRCFYQLDQLDEAIYDLEAVYLMDVEANDDPRFTCQYLFTLYFKKGDYVKSDYYAEECYQMGSSMVPLFNLTRGYTKYELEEYNECVKFCNNAAVTDSTLRTRVDLLTRRGVAYLELGFLADAYQDLCQVYPPKVLSLYDLEESEIDFSLTSHYSKYYELPKIDNNKTDLKILAIEATDEKTVVTVEYTNSEHTPYGWYNILPTAYLIDASGKKFRLLTTENCVVGPDKHTDIGYRETAKFRLIFEAIPKDCSRVDFIESNDSEWKIYGIHLVE